MAAALDRPALAPDLPGHGTSSAPLVPGARALPRLLGRLLALLDRLRLPRVLLVGYSLGARVALHLALDRPERVTGLVLVGGTPGIPVPAERAARAAEDRAQAAALLETGAAAFLAGWQRRPLIATQSRAAPEHRRRMTRWRAAASARGLALALAELSPGVLPARWDDLPALRPPLLLVTGAEDEKFSAIARQMRARLPLAEHRLVPGAGHAPHLERPRETAALLRGFGSRCV